MGMKIIPEIYHMLPSNPVDKLLLCFESQDEIATFCFVTPQAVWNWKNRDSIPKVYVEDLSRYTGIPPWLLCPKHFKKGESDVSVQSFGEGRGQIGAVQGSDVGTAVRAEGMLEVRHEGQDSRSAGQGTGSGKENA